MRTTAQELVIHLEATHLAMVSKLPPYLAKALGFGHLFTTLNPASYILIANSFASHSNCCCFVTITHLPASAPLQLAFHNQQPLEDGVVLFLILSKSMPITFLIGRRWRNRTSQLLPTFLCYKFRRLVWGHRPIV